MNNIQIFADKLMCGTRVITYGLVLISTLKMRVPAMAPVSCAVIFPWEFLMMLNNILGSVHFNYAVMGHLGFALLDFMIIFVILFRLRYYNQKNTIRYFILLIAITVLLALIFQMKRGVLYTSYINTIIGVFIWLIYIAKNDYPFTFLNFTILITKLIADVLACITYCDWDNGLFLICLSIFLPLLDVCHIAVFLIEKYRKSFVWQKKSL